MASNGVKWVRNPRYRPRLCNTGESVRNVLLIIWKDELETEGICFGDLLAFLDGLQVPVAVSPCHDCDTWSAEGVLNWCTMHLNEETGDVDEGYIWDDFNYEHDNIPYVGKPKKAHWHLVFKATSQHDARWWSELMSPILDVSVTRWEKCLDWRSSVCYLCHLHSQDKVLYPISEVHAFGGFDTSCMYIKSEAEKTELLLAIQQMIAAANVRYFHQLVDLVQTSPELLNYVRGSHSYFNSYLYNQRLERLDLQKKREAEKKKREMLKTT